MLPSVSFAHWFCNIKIMMTSISFRWPLSVLLMTIFALSLTAFAKDQAPNCGFTSEEELKLQAQSQLNSFAEVKNFDRWIYLQAWYLSNGETFDPKSAEVQFHKREKSLKADWAQARNAIPAFKLVENILNELHAHPAFQGEPTHLPSIQVGMIGGCDAICILSGDAFIIFVNPLFVLRLTNTKKSSPLRPPTELLSSSLPTNSATPFTATLT